jgi:hypothetical protein
MNTCLVIFTRSPSWRSRLICWLTGSKWSHSAVYLPGPRGGVFDSLIGFGVRPPRTLFSFLAGFPDHEAWAVPLPNAADALVFAEGSVGTEYDERGLLWWLFPWRDWQDPERWFCFEHSATLLAWGNVEGAITGPAGGGGASHVSGRQLYDHVSRVGRLTIVRGVAP